MEKHFNFPRQKKTRKFLRNNATKAERILWTKLRNKQLLGYKFRRQQGIERYIVDFFCSEKKLAIEIDGVTHYTDEEIEYDKQRQACIEQLGIRLVRVTNEDVYKNLDGVLRLIAETLMAAS